MSHYTDPEKGNNSASSRSVFWRMRDESRDERKNPTTTSTLLFSPSMDSFHHLGVSVDPNNNNSGESEKEEEREGTKNHHFSHLPPSATFTHPSLFLRAWPDSASPIPSTTAITPSPLSSHYRFPNSSPLPRPSSSGFSCNSSLTSFTSSSSFSPVLRSTNTKRRSRNTTQKNQEDINEEEEEQQQEQEEEDNKVKLRSTTTTTPAAMMTTAPSTALPRRDGATSSSTPQRSTLLYRMKNTKEKAIHQINSGHPSITVPSPSPNTSHKNTNNNNNNNKSGPAVLTLAPFYAVIHVFHYHSPSSSFFSSSEETTPFGNHEDIRARTASKTQRMVGSGRRRRACDTNHNSVIDGPSNTSSVGEGCSHPCSMEGHALEMMEKGAKEDEKKKRSLTGEEEDEDEKVKSGGCTLCQWRRNEDHPFSSIPEMRDSCPSYDHPTTTHTHSLRNDYPQDVHHHHNDKNDDEDEDYYYWKKEFHSLKDLTRVLGILSKEMEGLRKQNEERKKRERKSAEPQPPPPSPERHHPSSSSPSSSSSTPLLYLFFWVDMHGWPTAAAPFSPPPPSPPPLLLLDEDGLCQLCVALRLHPRTLDRLLDIGNRTEEDSDVGAAVLLRDAARTSTIRSVKKHGENKDLDKREEYSTEGAYRHHRRHRGRRCGYLAQRTTNKRRWRRGSSRAYSSSSFSSSSFNSSCASSVCGGECLLEEENEEGGGGSAWMTVSLESHTIMKGDTLEALPHTEWGPSNRHNVVASSSSPPPPPSSFLSPLSSFFFSSSSFISPPSSSSVSSCFSPILSFTDSYYGQVTIRCLSTMMLSFSSSGCCLSSLSSSSLSSWSSRSSSEGVKEEAPNRRGRGKEQQEKRQHKGRRRKNGWSDNDNDDDHHHHYRNSSRSTSQGGRSLGSEEKRKTVHVVVVGDENGKTKEDEENKTKQRREDEEESFERLSTRERTKRRRGCRGKPVWTSPRGLDSTTISNHSTAPLICATQLLIFSHGCLTWCPHSAWRSKSWRSGAGASSPSPQDLPPGWMLRREVQDWQKLEMAVDRHFEFLVEQAKSLDEMWRQRRRKAEIENNHKNMNNTRRGRTETPSSRSSSSSNHSRSRSCGSSSRSKSSSGGSHSSKKKEETEEEEEVAAAPPATTFPSSTSFSRGGCAPPTTIIDIGERLRPLVGGKHPRQLRIEVEEEEEEEVAVVLNEEDQAYLCWGSPATPSGTRKIGQGGDDEPPKDSERGWHRSSWGGGGSSSSEDRGGREGRREEQNNTMACPPWGVAAQTSRTESTAPSSRRTPFPSLPLSMTREKRGGGRKKKKNRRATSTPTPPPVITTSTHSLKWKTAQEKEEEHKQEYHRQQQSMRSPHRQWKPTLGGKGGSSSTSHPCLFLSTFLLPTITEAFIPDTAAFLCEVDNVDAMLPFIVPDCESDQADALRRVLSLRRSLSTHRRWLLYKLHLVEQFYKEEIHAFLPFACEEPDEGVKDMEDNQEETSLERGENREEDEDKVASARKTRRIFLSQPEEASHREEEEENDDGEGEWREKEIMRTMERRPFRFCYDALRDSIEDVLWKLRGARVVLGNATIIYNTTVTNASSRGRVKHTDMSVWLNIIAIVVIPLNVVACQWGMNCYVPGKNSDSLFVFWCIVGGMVIASAIGFIYPFYLFLKAEKKRKKEKEKMKEKEKVISL